MTDFLVQDAQKNGIGLAAHRHRHIMGKRDIAVGHQIIKTTVPNILLCRHRLRISNIRLADAHCCQALFRSIIINPLPSRKHLFQKKISIIMPAWAGGTRPLRQHRAAPDYSYIIKLQIRK